MITLGIETSCDETALALIETRTVDGVFECRVIQSLVHSQAELHSAYGGVYPSLAKREHGKNLLPLLSKLLIETDGILDQDRKVEDFDHKLEPFLAELERTNPDLYLSFKGAEFLKNIPRIDSIAVTEGPGLEPTLWVGISFARILGALWNIPVVPINHMEGHILGSLLQNDKASGTWQELHPLPLPAIALLISGGHTELVSVTNGTNSVYKYEIMGATKDDAVGEAYDKVARLLGLPYPGGPHVSKMAFEASELLIPAPVKLPRPMIQSGDLQFSFAGLKTAVLYTVQKATLTGTFDDTFKKGLALEFQNAVKDVLDFKLRQAIETINAKAVIIGGGVSANHTLRETFKKTASDFNIPLFLPSPHISGDNALMIALVGALNHPNTSEGQLTSASPTVPLKAHGTKKLGV